MMKKMLAALAAAVLTAGIGVTATAAEEVRVVVDGDELVTDQSAVVVNDRTLLPVRAVAEAVGAEVSWDDGTETATITTDEAELIIELGSYSLTLNTPGVAYVIEMDVPAQTINDRTMIPVRVVAESLGLSVCWSEEANTAYIGSSNAVTAIAGSEGFSDDENCAMLFDCDTQTKWCTANITGYDAEESIIDVDDFIGAYTIFKLSEPAYVTGYAVTTGNDNSVNTGRNPKTWTLYGCNASSAPDVDYSGWTEIDSVIGDTTLEDTDRTSYYYSVANEPDKYQYYMLKVFSNQGNYAMQMSELSLAYENTKYSFTRTAAKAANDEDFELIFAGDWDLVTDKEYIANLEELFYRTYPRLYARFGIGDEPKTVTFIADGDYSLSGTAAYSDGDTVVVSVDYANAHPEDLGYFSHELTHVVQQYGSRVIYGGDAWWVENLANYGGFRYYHWADEYPEEEQVGSADDVTLQDWGYQPYGNNKWFFSYMDYMYPTTMDSSGNLDYGLIDSINLLIKYHISDTLDDDPYDTSTPINKLVKEITGYDCIESLRLQYVEDLTSGKWSFTGFAGYADNFLTENLEGVENPSYPSM